MIKAARCDLRSRWFKWVWVGAILFCANVRGAEAQGIPFVDLPKPYENSGPLVSIPARLIGGTVGMAVGVLFVPPAIIVSILPGFGLFDALIIPPRAGWSIGEHTLGRVVGFPLWLVKKIAWDLPTAILLDG